MQTRLSDGKNTVSKKVSELASDNVISGQAGSACRAAAFIFGELFKSHVTFFVYY